MPTNQADIQAIITQVQAGRDSLAAAIATRQAKIAADQADTQAAQQAVTDGAQHRQNNLDALIASQQAEADAQLKAEQDQVAADAADVAAQQATLDLDAQGLAALDASLATLNGLLASAPPAPVVPAPIAPAPVVPTFDQNFTPGESVVPASAPSAMPPFVANPSVVEPLV